LEDTALTLEAVVSDGLEVLSPRLVYKCNGVFWVPPSSYGSRINTRILHGASTVYPPDSLQSRSTSGTVCATRFATAFAVVHVAA